MNLNFKLLLIACLLLVSVSTNYAQKVTFDDVLDIRLQNMGPILENNQVKGYYYFYKVDKVDRKNNAYLLQIQDENLNEVAKKRMTFPRTTSLTEATYNGTAFLFSFVDTREKNLQLITYDKAMEQLGKRTIELDKTGMAMYQGSVSGQSNSDDDASNKFIFPVGNKGFVRYTALKNKKIGYELEYLSNDLKKANSWSKSSPEDSKTIMIADYADASEKYLASVITMKPKLLSNKDITFAIKVLDVENKKVAFEKELSDSKYLYSFMSCFISEDEQSLIVFGEYYKKDDDILKDRSQGLAALQLDMTGKIINSQQYSWASDISKKIGVNSKGKIDDGGYVAFHKIVQTSDGHYYAVGEMYKKAASGLGIAGAMLGGSNVSVVKVVIMDLITFDFNPDLTLNHVTVFEKKRNDVNLPAGWGHYPPSMLALLMRYWGEFDYAYTQIKEDKSSFFSTYISSEREKGEKRKDFFGIISKTEGDADFVTDKIDLSTEATRIRVYPAKTGYIMLTEYFRKAKKLESRLEKINY